jgi:PAS domain S-box-containing protein
MPPREVDGAPSAAHNEVDGQAELRSRMQALAARARELELERDDARRVLRESTQLYRTLIESADVGFCILEMLFDGDGNPIDYRFIETNRAFENQTGLHDAVGRTARELVPRLESYWVERYGAVASTGQPLHFVQHSEAMGRWFDVHAFPISAPEQRRVALLFSDITAQKRAEQEAEQARRKLQATIDSITDGLLVLDSEWRVTYVSETAARMIGMTREQMIGHEVWSLFPHAVGTRFQEQYERAVETGRPVHFEEFYPEPLNIWLECHGYPSAEGLSVYFRDITDRKHGEDQLRASEQRLRLALSAGVTGAWEWDLVAGSASISDSYRELFGLPADAPFGYDEWLAAVHPDDRERCRAYGEAFFASPDASEWRIEFRIVTPHRGIRWHRAIGQLQRDADGRPLRFIGVSSDITEHKQVEQALVDAKRVAEEASRAKSQFLAVMSHELRTPLSGMIGYSDLLASGVLGPVNDEQRDALERMKSGAWHLVGIIDDILSLSRVEAGKEEVNWEETDVAAIARDVARIVEPQIRSRRLGFDVVNADAPVRVESDPGKVRQILINLVGNAAKYTERGSVTIRLDADAEWLRVEVRDTGPGIAPADQDRIFEAFTQVDSSHTRSASGTGLGLAISRRLSRMLGGDVTLESTPGVGSTFALRLPRQRPSDAGDLG